MGDLLNEFFARLLGEAKKPGKKPVKRSTKKPAKKPNRSPTTFTPGSGMRAARKAAHDANLKAIGRTGWWSRSGNPPAEASTRGGKFVYPLPPKERKEADAELGVSAKGQAGRPKKKSPEEREPKEPSVKKTSRGHTDTIKPTGNARELNIASLAEFIRTGEVLDASGKPSKPPGNDFSRYSEAVSSFAAQYVAANPNASMEEILARVVEVDCKSELLNGKVSFDIPKKSPLYAEFKALEAKGVFKKGCGANYSEQQNMARFMTAIVARAKGQRLNEAVAHLQGSGLLPEEEVQVDAFSGDYQSKQRMKSAIESMPEGAKLFTETGEELSREEALRYVERFGTADFPADTAMLATDSQGNLVLMGFSDKKELNAIINNTSVTSDFRRDLAAIDAMLTSDPPRITEEQATQARAAIEKATKDFEVKEDEIKQLGDKPIDGILDKFENGSSEAEIDEVIENLKKAAPKKNGEPDRYFMRRIVQPFSKAADKFIQGKQTKELKWLNAAGWPPENWDGKTGPTEAQMVRAWALRCRAIHNGEVKNPQTGEPATLDTEDLTLLANAGVVDRKELFGKLGQLRSDALKVLTDLRAEMDKIRVSEDIGLGTLLDAARCWEALHLDMGDYKGALTVVAGETVVDFASIEECLRGISSSGAFARTLQIDPDFQYSRELTDAEGKAIVTGQTVEVFSVSPEGDRINVGEKAVRSKQGVFGKLQVTWTYHKDFQKCLKQHTR